MRGLWLPAIFIGIPLIEIALFVQIGGRIGLGWTIFIVVATAIAGTALLKMQGLSVMNRAQDAMNAGEMPVESLIDALFLLIAGILLLTPGFLTDLIGFLFFIPPVRQNLGRFLWRQIAKSGSIHFQEVRSGGTTGGRRPGQPGSAGGPIIDGEIIESTTTETEPDAVTDGEDLKQAKINQSKTDSPWRQ
jgi:UPF0716 protein FxsA